MNPDPYFVFDDRNHQIRLRQNHLTGRVLITIPGERVGPTGWNSKKNLPRDPNQIARLQNLLTRLNKAERKLIARGLVNPSLKLVWEEQFRPEDPTAPNSNLIKDWCVWKASLSGYHYKRGFLNIIAHLDDWNRPGALLVDLNETWVYKYCEYLAKDRGLRTATINKQVGYLRQVQKAAAANNQPVGTIPDRLRASAIGGAPSAIRSPLTFDQVMALYALDGLPRHLAIIRDMFLIMAFTGLRVGDLLSPVWLIQKDRITHIQGKTKGTHTITLNAISRELISRNSTVGLDGTYQLTLPDHSGQYLNRQYAKLARAAHIKATITNHIGRHTFARILGDIGLNENLRAAELGHRRSVTSGYGMIDADFQVKLVSKRWEKALGEWRGAKGYEAWYEAMNS